MSKAEPQFAITERFLDQPYTLAGRLIDPVSGMLSRQGKREHLRRKELEVLALLASADGKQVSRDNFISVVWQGNDLVGDRGLTNTIVFLRRSLRDEDTDQPLIRTIPRRGYQLAVPVQNVAVPAVTEVDATFVPGGMIPECPGWRLVKRLSQATGVDSWLAEPSEFGERDQGLRVFRFCRSEAHLQRLRREVTLLRYLRDSLGQNPHFALIQDWQLDEPPYFLARDYTAFGTIGQWGGLTDAPLAQRMTMMQGLCDAVAAMHALGVVHRRLNADTILVDSSDSGPQLKISAFDLAALSDRSKLEPLKITALGLTRGVEDASVELTAADDICALSTVLLQLALADLQAQPNPEWLNKITNSKLQTLLNACFGLSTARPSAAELAAQLRSINSPEIAAPALSVPTPAIDATEAKSAAKAKLPNTANPVNMPETIGHYRLLDRLGEGGMGSVYLAEQREPYRQVALKVIRSGLDGQQILSRFEAERQALALMNHPNVTTVLDSGLSADGRPFFAMEYVKGDDITQYCDAHNLNLPARIKLFLQVCDGVLHAHQKGVLHRDIKPSNLMVSCASESAGTVKIIDFGLAKSLHGKLAAHTLHTSFGAFIGTPVYCSPEHIAGSAGGVDTRSDIYSMGVVLYELLAGTTPIATESLENLEPEKVRELVCKSKLPSMREQLQNTKAEKRLAIAEHRSIKLDELPKTLEGDLSWVVGKCLERDPNDRYASVLELRKDLERWLELRPVEARPTSRWYRFRKFVRRNRALSVASAASLAIIILSTTAAFTAYLRAERAQQLANDARQEAQLASEFQVSQMKTIDPEMIGFGLRRGLIQSTKLRLIEGGGVSEPGINQLETLIEGVDFTNLVATQLDETYFKPSLEVIAKKYESFPALQASLWQSSADTLYELGLFQRALETQELALARRDKLFGPNAQLTLESKAKKGRILTALDRVPEAIAILDDTLNEMRSHTGLDYEAALGALTDRATIRASEGHIPEAIKTLAEVRDRAYRLFGENDERTLFAEVEHAKRLSIDEAEVALTAAVKKLEVSVGPEHIETTAAMAEIAWIKYQKNVLVEAISIAREILLRRRKTLGAEHPSVFAATNALASYLGQARQMKEAVPLFRTALNGYEGLLGKRATKVAIVRGNFGLQLWRNGELLEAETNSRFAAQTFRELYGPDSFGESAYATNLGAILLIRGDYGSAQKLLETRLEFEKKQSGSALKIAEAHEMLGQILIAQGKFKTACDHFRSGLNAMKDESKELDYMILKVKSSLAWCIYKSQGDQNASESLAQVAALQRTSDETDILDLAISLIRLSTEYNDKKNFNEALEVSAEGLQKTSAVFPNGHYIMVEAFTQKIRAHHGMGQSALVEQGFSDAKSIIERTPGLDPAYERALRVAVKGGG